MTAEPVPEPQSPLDPARILADLPENEREFFLAEYRTLAEGVRELDGWNALYRWLRLWRFHADNTKDPEYWKDREAAHNGTGGGMLLEDYIRMRRGA